jgi:ABC-type multidrug transport system ATPase subunit
VSAIIQAQTVRKVLSASVVSHAIVCDDIKKVYPGRDGNPPKYAVKGLSLAIPRGECFGMLGPNGAGKTTSISMVYFNVI